MCVQKLSKILVNYSKSANWDIIARCIMTTKVDLPPIILKSSSFLFQNQQVKVDSNIYHLDRLRSSLKSNYFAKLFTSGEFKQKSDKILEILPKNSELFPAIVDLLHGEKLLDVLNKDNCIPLLEAMDYLEMEIDLKIVSSFIENNLTSYSPQDANLFELYSFIEKNTEFKYLQRSVFKSMSGHLTTVRNHKIFSSLPLGHLIEIITCVQNPDDKKRYEIVQMCAEWLCHDMENRLPHMIILINSIKPGFHSEERSDESNSKLRKRLPKTDIDEQAKQKFMINCVFSLLAYGGKLNPNIIAQDDDCEDYYTDREWDEEKKEEYEIHEQNHTSVKHLHYDQYNSKLRKYLKNGDFCDITVRVGEKTYKLHRAILESKSDYFAEIFRAEYSEAMNQHDGIPKFPCIQKEYLLDQVDQSSFDAVIKNIYFGDGIPFDYDVIPSAFKTADLLKIEELSSDLEKKLKWRSAAKVNSKNKIEILKITHGKAKYNDLHSMYLCKHMREKWPEIYDMSKFCSISWPLLKITLKSPHFHFDDPHKILDVCSTWVIHDVKNRYRLLPEIAKIINPNCVPNHEKYAAENAASNDHSQQLIRDELWEILSSIEYLTSSQSIPTNTTENLEDIPAFIAEKRIGPGHLHALNATLDDITPKGIFEDRFKYNHYSWCMSTALIGDNVYFFSSGPSSLLFYEPILFFLHNFKLNKSYKLASDNRIKTPAMKFTLLNCNDEIYCCSETGSLMAKYSMQFNRWMILSQQSQNETSYIPSIRFVSDGKNLYRTHEVYENDSWNYIIGTYDFEKNLWTRVPDLPPIRSSLFSGPLQLIVINDGDLAVTFLEQIVVFDRDSKTWRHHKIPQELLKEKHLFVQHGDRLLFVVDDKLYHVSLSDDKWEFKKNFDLTTIRPIN